MHSKVHNFLHNSVFIQDFFVVTGQALLAPSAFLCHYLLSLCRLRRRGGTVCRNGFYVDILRDRPKNRFAAFNRKFLKSILVVIFLVWIWSFPLIFFFCPFSSMSKYLTKISSQIGMDYQKGTAKIPLY